MYFFVWFWQSLKKQSFGQSLMNFFFSKVERWGVLQNFLRCRSKHKKTRWTNTLIRRNIWRITSEEKLKAVWNKRVINPENRQSKKTDCLKDSNYVIITYGEEYIARSAVSYPLVRTPILQWEWREDHHASLNGTLRMWHSNNESELEVLCRGYWLL